MADDLYLLNREDMLVLRKMVEQFKRDPRMTRNRMPVEDELGQSPEVYIARTPSSGISGPSSVGTGTGSSSAEETVNSAECAIYQKLANGNLQHIVGFNKTVYSLSQISGDIWILIERDKFGVWWVVESSIGYKDATIASYSLTTSWSNIGTSFTLPANSTWYLSAQINAQIVSSSSGAGDSISCRFYDGSAVAGCPVEFCNAVCDSLTYVGAAPLLAVYTAGSSGATVNIQGVVNTSSASTGSILACGSLAGGQLVGVRLS